MAHIQEWITCDFEIMRYGEEVRIIRYRRVSISGPNSAIYDFTIVSQDGAAMVARYEMKCITSR